MKQNLLRKFKPGFDVTFEEVLPIEGETTSIRSLQRYVSHDEDYYSETQPITDRMDF